MDLYLHSGQSWGWPIVAAMRHVAAFDRRNFPREAAVCTRRMQHRLKCQIVRRLLATHWYNLRLLEDKQGKLNQRSRNVDGGKPFKVAPPYSKEKTKTKTPNVRQTFCLESLMSHTAYHWSLFLFYFISHLFYKVTRVPGLVAYIFHKPCMIDIHLLCNNWDCSQNCFVLVMPMISSLPRQTDFRAASNNLKPLTTSWGWWAAWMGTSILKEHFLLVIIVIHILI